MDIFEKMKILLTLNEKTMKPIITTIFDNGEKISKEFTYEEMKEIDFLILKMINPYLRKYKIQKLLK